MVCLYSTSCPFLVSFEEVLIGLKHSVACFWGFPLPPPEYIGARNLVCNDLIVMLNPQLIWISIVYNEKDINADRWQRRHCLRRRMRGQLGWIPPGDRAGNCQSDKKPHWTVSFWSSKWAAPERPERRASAGSHKTSKKKFGAVCSGSFRWKLRLVLLIVWFSLHLINSRYLWCKNHARNYSWAQSQSEMGVEISVNVPHMFGSDWNGEKSRYRPSATTLHR